MYGKFQCYLKCILIFAVSRINLPDRIHETDYLVKLNYSTTTIIGIDCILKLQAGWTLVILLLVGSGWISELFLQIF